MPNHTFTYRAPKLAPPLEQLIGWLGSQLAACHHALDKISDEVERETAKANEPRPSTLSELARVANTVPDRKAFQEQKRLLAQLDVLEHDRRRAVLLRNECLRAGYFKKFTLDEPELTWLYRWSMPI